MLPPLAIGNTPSTSEVKLTVEPNTEVKVTDPPKDTAPPPDIPEPGLMVIEELARSLLDIVPFLISVVVIVPSVMLTAPEVTVKNEDENEAKPKVVLVAVSG